MTAATSPIYCKIQHPLLKSWTIKRTRLSPPLHKSSNPFPIGRIRLRPKINFQKIFIKVQKIWTSKKESERNFISRVKNMTKLIFLSSKVILLPNYFPAIENAKNCQNFRQRRAEFAWFWTSKSSLTKKIWRNRNGFDSNSKIYYLRLDES